MGLPFIVVHRLDFALIDIDEIRLVGCCLFGLSGGFFVVVGFGGRGTSWAVPVQHSRHLKKITKIFIVIDDDQALVVDFVTPSLLR